MEPEPRRSMLPGAPVALVLALFAAFGAVLLFLSLGAPAHPEPAAAEAAAAPPAPAFDAFASTTLEAKAAIVYDLATGDTLYAKNAQAQLPLASLTKLLTMYAAFADLTPDAPITITTAATEQDYPRIFNEDQVFKLEDIARVTLVASLNDGATAIAQALAAREGVPVGEALDETAERLGLAQTFAVNGNGLDATAAVSGGYGSARDVAVLAGALVQAEPEIARATIYPTATATSQGGTTYTVSNTDPVVTSIPHLLLSKTGYTDLAGGNLALVFDVGINHPVAVVVLGSTKDARFTDGQALVNATFAHFAGVAPQP